MITAISGAFCSGLNFNSKINRKIQPKQNKSENKVSNTALFNAYYIPLNFKGNAKVDKLISDIGHNGSEPDILLEISKLDNAESRRFVRKYCEKTGFPDLKKVNANMKNHAIGVLSSAAQAAGVDILYAGFHKQCSAASSLALPGSDLDAMGVILTGNQQQIYDFKGFLWDNFDPSFVSIRKDYEFPDVYSLDQLYEWTKLIDEIVEEEGLYKKEAEYLANLREQKDFEKALEFNIDIAHSISKYSKEELRSRAPSVAEYIEYETPKNTTQSISSLLESLREGNILISNENLTPEQRRKLRAVKESYLYKYGNICMQGAQYDIKPKLLRRKKLINEENFAKLSITQQKNLILRMLYESYPSWSKSKVNVKFGHEFDPLFDNGDGLNELRNKAFGQAVDS